MNDKIIIAVNVGIFLIAVFGLVFALLAYFGKNENDDSSEIDDIISEKSITISNIKSDVVETGQVITSEILGQNIDTEVNSVAVSKDGNVKFGSNVVMNMFDVEEVGLISTENAKISSLQTSGLLLTHKDGLISTSTINSENVVTVEGEETITNKTLTNPVLNSPVLNNSGLITLPEGPEVLVALNTIDILKNKTLNGVTMTGTLALGNNSISVDDNKIVTSTELSYNSGVTSSIQTQLNSLQSGIVWIPSSKAATTEVIIGTYDNTNATITGTASLAAIDGVNLEIDDILLVKTQDNKLENGVYVVTSITNPFILTRSSKMRTDSNAAGRALFVQQGTLNGDTSWLVTSDSNSDVVGTDALEFSQISGSGSFTGGDGIDIVSNEISVDSSVVKSTGFQTLTNKTLVKPMVDGVLEISNKYETEQAVITDFAGGAQGYDRKSMQGFRFEILKSMRITNFTQNVRYWSSNSVRNVGLWTLDGRFLTSASSSRNSLPIIGNFRVFDAVNIDIEPGTYILGTSCVALEDFVNSAQTGINSEITNVSGLNRLTDSFQVPTVPAGGTFPNNSMVGGTTFNFELIDEGTVKSENLTFPQQVSNTLSGILPNTKMLFQTAIPLYKRGQMVTYGQIKGVGQVFPTKTDDSQNVIGISTTDGVSGAFQPIIINGVTNVLLTDGVSVSMGDSLGVDWTAGNGRANLWTSGRGFLGIALNSNTSLTDNFVLCLLKSSN